ncbi:MAG: SAM-dependent methyltransferase [Proteobacteria bacterium]|nr:SAM-dependent methyltransferase [Pseudomonadota bacterium]
MGKKLQDIISEEIAQSGPIPFSRFMERCLYHPQFGYYRKTYLPIGKSGDFYTSPCVHSIFGHTIARQIVEFLDTIEDNNIFLIEAGAGRGHLARDIGEYLKNNKIDVSLIIIEPHKAFRDIQLSEVKDFFKEVIFLNSPEDLSPIKGVFYCNELFDSFPVEIIENLDGKIYQVYVDFQEGVFKEVLLPVSDGIMNFINFWDIKIPDGFRTEICPSAESFYKNILSNIKEGFSLIIDYGYTQEEFFLSHRRKGTLMCYKSHLADENPYELVGEKDITAHINFSLISKIGEKAGFDTVGFTDQQYFLMGCGILEEIELLKNSLSQRDYEREIAMIKNLILNSMGYVFKFLCQKKGVSKTSFKGFSIRNYRKNL